MAAKFASKDLRETEEGRKLLEEGRPKKGKGEKVWGKGHGPTACAQCFGYCCGSNPYPKSWGRVMTLFHKGVQTEEEIFKVMIAL